ncbi:sugar phosphate nucleotidyltransferase [Chloroflexota bacterium]
MQKKKNPLKAVILVGGEGTRLRPLTYIMPKSMVPVLNHPFLEHTIAYLKQYGVKQIILALSYYPEAIRDYFGDGSNLGTQLTYFVESTPMGTAGAVKNAEQCLGGTFIVLNGDVFTDINIADMIAFHRSKGAKATIALTRVDNPCAFGVVETSGDGRIQKFIEKPSPDKVTSNWINAGIYILEPEVLKYVPEGCHYMFEKGLFPLLLEMGETVYGYHFDGYWLDIGTPEKYLCLNCDLLLSKVKNFLGSHLRNDEVFCDKEAVIHPSARISGPAIIASGCRISQNVHVKGPVIMAPDCYIGEGASLEESVLWQGVQIGAGAILKQCVIGSNTKIGDKEKVANRVVVPHSH